MCSVLDSRGPTWSLGGHGGQGALGALESPPVSMLTLLLWGHQETEKIIAELNETWEEKLRKTEAIRMER